MSAHLQFGPEWMRKGPGSKTPTTPSNEASFALSPPSSDPLAGGGTGGADTSTKSSEATGKGAGTSAGARRNTSVSHVGPMPVTTPSNVLPSPGAVSFAAAASGAAASPSTGGGGVMTSGSDRLFGGGEGGSGDATRYSKRLLSLYSTERGPSHKGATTSGSDPSYPAQSSTTPSSTTAAPSTQTAFGRRKNFDSREPGRRSQSINTDVANALTGSGGPTTGRSFPLAAIDGRSDSQRPGLFQRGSSSANASATSPTTAAVQHPAVSPTTLQQYRGAGDRERHSSVGIQGGVLSSVTPAAGVTKRAQKDNGGENSTGHADGAVDADGQGNNRDTWSRMRRERLPGEGPIGPPTDHNGGFAKGFDRRRERQASAKRSLPPPEAQSLAPVSLPRNASTTTNAGRGGTGQINPSMDDGLSHHAATLVETLKLDEDEEEINLSKSQAVTSTPHDQHLALRPDAVQVDRPTWSAETAEWFYRDPSGQVQGPFKANMMQSWYAANYFTDDLLVRRAEVDIYTPLGVLLQMIGESVTPFLVPPTQYAVQQAPAVQPLTNTGLPAYLPHSRMGPAYSNASGWASSPSISPALMHDYGLANGGRQSPFLTNPALSGLAGGRSSPFATPPVSLADLDGQRQQQSDYLLMIRQRELAEQQHHQHHQRLLQEQRNAQLAAMAMSQQGRGGDLSRGWSHADGASGPFASSAAAGRPNDGWDTTAPLQPTHQEHAQHTFTPQYNHQESLPSYDERRAQLDSHPLQTQHDQETASTTRADQQHSESSEARENEQLLSTEPTVEAKISDQGETGELEKGDSDHSVNVTIDTQSVDEAAEVGAGDVDATSPERLWPQSPSAVEFASEPTLEPIEATTGSASLAAQPEGMTIVKNNKKSRRAAAANSRSTSLQGVDQSENSSPNARSAGPGGLNVVDEEQFRRGQAAVRTNIESSSLSAWVPDETMTSLPTAAKAAPWANSSGSVNGQESLSLREIQDVEARRAQALKVAQQQQQQQQQQRTMASYSSSELPLNMSWGLASVPSSVAQQTQQQSTQSSSGAASAAPVWNASTGRTVPPKKTLTEIQEEERKRAHKASQASTANAGSAPVTAIKSGRGYAALAGKATGGVTGVLSPPPMSSVASSVPPASQQQQSGWAVVGASGKPNPAPSTVTTAAAPAMTRTASGQVRTAVPRSTSSSGAGSSSGASGSGSALATQPSAGFLRHCKEQLKGLNVKVDDFIEMLLSFPLDPSPDVVEIIAESVYANSNTLDGRRFAADFVAKRKLDVTAQLRVAGGGEWNVATNGASVNRARAARGGNDAVRPNGVSSAVPSPATPSVGGAPTTASGGTRSASDVLRSPAARSSSSSSDAFGGFKVVKAKSAKKRT